MGCGVGDTIYPLKEKYPNLKFFGCDFSSKAIEWCKLAEPYDPKKTIFQVCDLVNDEIPSDFELPDLVTLIFVLSAISPENH